MHRAVFVVIPPKPRTANGRCKFWLHAHVPRSESNAFIRASYRVHVNPSVARARCYAWHSVQVQGGGGGGVTIFIILYYLRNI